jgi:hypothetical protein
MRDFRTLVVSGVDVSSAFPGSKTQNVFHGKVRLGKAMALFKVTQAARIVGLDERQLH